MIAEHYLVSRYAPGQDLDETWTGLADVGSSFGGEVLTEDTYLSVENRYLYAFSVFMKECDVQQLTVLEPSVSGDVPEAWRTLADGDTVGPEDALQLLRLMLREDVDARLEVPDSFYIHVGYDLMAYVGVPKAVPYAVDEARSIGLYVDPGLPSPMIPDPADRFWWLTEGRPVRHRVASFDKATGHPLERWDVPAATLPAITALVPPHADDPSHWDKYELTDDQLAQVLPQLGLTRDPERDYTLVTYTDD